MNVTCFGRNFRLLKEEELGDLLQILEAYLPESLKFHQTLKTYLNDRVCEFYFYVPHDWPRKTICLHFPGVTQTTNGDIYRSFGVFCPLRKLHYLQLLQEEDVLINWNQCLHMNYTHHVIMEHIENFYNRIGVVMNKVSGDFYMCSDLNSCVGTDEDYMRLQEKGIVFQQIKKEDVQLVHSLYPAQDLESVAIFEKLIEKLASCGIYVNGELAAWMVQSYYGAMFSMQTRPDYRRKGFGELVARRLTHLVHSKGYIPFVLIVPDNTASQNLYTKLGFKKLYRNVRGILKPYKAFIEDYDSIFSVV